MYSRVKSPRTEEPSANSAEGSSGRGQHHLREATDAAAPMLIPAVAEQAVLDEAAEKETAAIRVQGVGRGVLEAERNALTTAGSLPVGGDETRSLRHRAERTATVELGQAVLLVVLVEGVHHLRGGLVQAAVNEARRPEETTRFRVLVVAKRPVLQVLPLVVERKTELRTVHAEVEASLGLPEMRPLVVGVPLLCASAHGSHEALLVREGVLVVQGGDEDALRELEDEVVHVLDESNLVVHDGEELLFCELVDHIVQATP